MEVKIQIDTREKITTYTKDLIDLRISKDGIKIVDVEMATVKPLDINTNLPCKTSTGDITFLYREKDTNNEWIRASFCIEVKKGLDFFSSLYMSDNKTRLYAELERAKEYGVKMFFVVENSLSDTIKQVQKSVPRLRNTNFDVIHYEQYVELNRKLVELGFDPIITCGNALAWSIRRCIKKYIKDEKLQYKI